MAVVATGGYGRGLLAPGSDIDLLFLLPYKQTAWGESVAEAILYCLWDMGLKVGHATRSVDECIRQAKADMTIRTALLEARFLLGDAQALRRADRRGSTRRWRRARRRNSSPPSSPSARSVTAAPAQSRYLVEPNVKDGKGGLRDLHTLFWIAKYVYRVHEPEELIARGVFDRDEYQLFRRCEDFLWSVRCHMHFLAGRAEERLSFDIQREIAVRLGYTEHPGLQDVERFMKHYFLIAKDVGDLTAILCAEPRGAPGQARAGAQPHDGALAPGAQPAHLERDRRLHRRQQPHQHRPRRRLPARSGQPDPLFHLAQKHNLAFHPEAMRSPPARSS